jgi:hypothetical protein
MVARLDKEKFHRSLPTKDNPGSHDKGSLPVSNVNSVNNNVHNVNNSDNVVEENASKKP